jgi:Tol biopolymer transport system component
MGKRLLVSSCAALVAIEIAGCVPGDSGGGGGLGSFSRGFAFVRERNVYVADNSDYAHPLQLTTNGNTQQPSLSPDGRQVVFVQGGNELDVVAASNGASPRRVLFASGGRANFRTPVISPDGNSIVFSYDRNSVSYLGRVGMDGTGFQELTSGQSYIGPSFYPDGASVLAAAGSSFSAFNQLVRVNLNTRSVTVVAGTLGSEACSVVNRVAVSPDGSRATFDARISSCSGPVRIFVVDLSNGRVNPRLTNYPADPNADDGFPTWVGADQVGFSSSVGGAEQVYVLPAASTLSSGRLTLPSASEPYYGPN